MRNIRKTEKSGEIGKQAGENIYHSDSGLSVR